MSSIRKVVKKIISDNVNDIDTPKKTVKVKKTKDVEEDVEETSKYGTYLRYKRISKYENRTKMHLRILYFLRNYDLNDRELIDEISKQFNITVEKAKEEIVKVRTKFPNVVKGKKSQFKKSDELPKFKPPGIGIDIQGKIPEKYKIRISGAREQHQLERIIVFMNVLEVSN